MDWEQFSVALGHAGVYMGLNTPVAVGAMIGSGIAFLAGRQPVGVVRRTTNAISGCAFAIYSADGFVEVVKMFVTIAPTDAMMRLLGMVMGLGGILICEFFINFFKRMSENGDDMADAVLGGAKDALKAIVDRVRGNPTPPAPVVITQAETGDGETGNAGAGG